MQIISYAKSHDRIADELRRVAPEARHVLIHDGGTLTCDGEPIEPAALAPEVAWLSRDFFITRGSPVREFLGLALGSSSLRWLQSGLAGLDLPVFPKLVARGVRLTANDASAPAIAEFVLAQVLGVFQPVAERLELQRGRRWGGGVFREIRGSTWLVVGVGRVGEAVGRAAGALGARVIGVRRGGAASDAADEIVTPDALPARLPEADVVVLAVPGGPATRHLADAGFFARVRPEAVFVNVARGSVVDEDALLAGLDGGRPAWAILDVFEHEPLPQASQLWTHPRVRVTAHKAAASTAVTGRGDRVFLDNLARWVAHEPLRLEVPRTHFAP